MNQLFDLLGREHDSDSVNRALRDVAQSHRCGAVGAVHVTCADECEREAVESFQQWFVNNLLPELKFSNRAPFRLANLGGRYEWGAIAIAEQHYATPATVNDSKLLVVKMNSHVSADADGGNLRFGLMDRYAAESTFCGAMHGLVGGAHGPAFDELRETFNSETKPRVEMLRDAVDPPLRPLLAAVVNARLQARRAVIDIQGYHPHTPTYYLVLSTVTINRKGRDTELPVGFYTADARTPEISVHYRGLGDDPTKYEVTVEHSTLTVEDDHLHHHRPARNHRDEILNLWIERRKADENHNEILKDPRFESVLRRVNQSDGDPSIYVEVLKTIGVLMLDVAPVPGSILLFAKGAVGAHHLYRVHRLAHGQADREAAEPVVREFLDNLDRVPPARAQAIVEAMLSHYQEHRA